MTWLPVVGYEGYYEVSDSGSVRSLDRVIHGVGRGRPHRRVGKVLTPFADKDGYLQVMLSVEAVKKPRKVHHLVLEAFVGLRPQGTECQHADDDVANNALANLSWGTKSTNCQQSHDNGGRMHVRHFGHSSELDKVLARR